MNKDYITGQLNEIFLKGIELGTDNGQPYIKYCDAAVDDILVLINKIKHQSFIEGQKFGIESTFLGLNQL